MASVGPEEGQDRVTMFGLRTMVRAGSQCFPKRVTIFIINGRLGLNGGLTVVMALYSLYTLIECMYFIEFLYKYM